MCTVLLLRRPGHAWPLLLAANRDERLDRPWQPPAEVAPGLVAGRDLTAGGTWMGLNRHGVVAAVLNRPGTLGPAPGRRSRGELPLLALAHGTAEAAAAALAALDAAAWRPFNLVVASARAAFFLRGEGAGRPEAMPLPDGVSMVTALDPNDLSSPRTRRHLPRFRQAPPPEPSRGDWSAWESLLADSAPDERGDSLAALNVPPRAGFGTLCASLLALPRTGPPVWRFAPGPPGQAPFAPVTPPRE